MGAGENSALDLPAPSLPSGVTAKMLLTTAPYNAQNPQTNQVRVSSFRFARLSVFSTPDTDCMHDAGRLSTAMPSTTSSSGAPSSRARSTQRARRSSRSSSPSALSLGYAPGRSCRCSRALPRIQISRGGSLFGAPSGPLAALRGGALEQARRRQDLTVSPPCLPCSRGSPVRPG